MIGRDVAVNKWCSPYRKVAMKGVTLPNDELTNDGLDPGLDRQVLTFVLAKARIKYKFVLHRNNCIITYLSL